MSFVAEAVSVNGSHVEDWDMDSALLESVVSQDDCTATLSAQACEILPGLS